MPEAEFPEFFKRVYDTHDIPELQIQGKITILTPQFTNLVIYGRKHPSPYEEDIPHEREMAERGRYMTECFSVECPEGELGSVSIGDVTPITKEEFTQAQNRRWVDP